MATAESGIVSAEDAVSTRSFRPRLLGRRIVTLAAALVGLAVFSLLIVFWPTGFVVYTPGPSDVLRLDDSEDMAIRIEGASVYPTNGTLLWASFDVTSKDVSLGLPEAVTAFLRTDWQVFPKELAYPVGRPVEQVVQEGADSSTPAQDNAKVAGLRAAGFSVSQAPVITYVVMAGPSYRVLQVNDIILAIDDESVRTASDVVLALAKHAVGDKVSLRVKGVSGTERDVSVQAGPGNASENTAKLGISFEDSYTYDPRISFSLGPHSSPTGGGLLLAVGVYELLGEEDLLAGRMVAASGTVDASGTVSSVAGITQKLVSAERDGADVFLLSSSSCANTPIWMGKMRVVVVADVAGAIDSLRRLRDDPLADVPHC